VFVLDAILDGAGSDELQLCFTRDAFETLPSAITRIVDDDRGSIRSRRWRTDARGLALALAARRESNHGVCEASTHVQGTNDSV
jgi:hypothetical protein